MTGHGLRRNLRRFLDSLTDQNLPDRELLQQFAAKNDQHAFSLLVRRHGPMVLRVCRRVLGNEQDAEDALQATFFVLARKAASKRWDNSIANWLYTVAYRLALAARTAASRRRMLENRAIPRTVHDPLADITLREAEALVDEELARIPDRFRAPLVLCCLEGYTRDEVARQLGYSLATLKRRLEKGRDLLRGRLQRRGLTLPAILLGVLVSERSARGLPPALVQSMASHAAGFVGGKMIGSMSASALALANRMILAMAFARLKTYLGVLLVIACAMTGAGWLASRTAHQVPEQAEVASAPHSPRGQTTAEIKNRTSALLETQPRPRQQLMPLPRDHVLCLALIAADNKKLDSPDHWIPLWLTAHDPEVCRIGASQWSGKGLISVTGGGAITPLNAHSADQRQRPHPHSKAKVVPVAVPMHVALGPMVIARNEGNYPHWEGDQNVVWWNPARAKVLLPVNDQGKVAAGPVLAPDGRTRAVPGSDGAIVLEDAISGRELRRLIGHRGPINAMVFSSDGRTLLSGGADETLRVWEIDSGKQLSCFCNCAIHSTNTQDPLAIPFDGAGTKTPVVTAAQPDSLLSEVENDDR